MPGTFNLFPDLPLELQYITWDGIACSPQAVTITIPDEITVGEEYSFGVTTQTSLGYNFLLQATHDSEAAALALREVAFPRHTLVHPALFNYERDMLVIPDWEVMGHFFASLIPEVRGGWNIDLVNLYHRRLTRGHAQIRYLAVCGQRHAMTPLWHAIATFPNLEVVYFEEP